MTSKPVPSKVTAVPPVTNRARYVRAALLAALALAGVIVGRQHVMEPLRVSSHSMSPTVRAGDQIFIDRISMRWAAPRRGDLVTFASPVDGTALLKRVVGVAGDRVALRDGALYVDDIPVPEPYVDLAQVDGVFYGPVVVPADHVLLMGDNRGDSIDSRAFGTVAVDAVDGRMLTRLWPRR